MTAVVALGDVDRRDDGAGPAVARALASRGLAVRLPDDDPVALLDALETDGAVVIVDAVVSGAPAGTIHRLEGWEHLPAPAAVSTHGVPLHDVLALANALGRLPRRVVVFGIEAADVRAGVGLTPAVARAVDVAAARILAEVA